MGIRWLALTTPLIVVAITLIATAAARVMAAADTVSLILIDGDMREDWPDHGVVGFHRLETKDPLMVNFAIGGTALAGTDYSAAAGTAITIPAGDREAWLEFAP